ncbi:MAG: Hsp20/alpha crystallin family protein [Leptospira sp.]|nr:Hsp20/alpha crystallin family protein [Leptospira sp.]
MSVAIDKTKEEKVSVDSKSSPARRERVHAPSVNVYENEKEAIFILDMPGVSETDLDISLDKGLLSIEGKINIISKDGYRKEYSESKVDVYRRKFNLGKLVDADNAVAKFSNGQLHLRLPKQEPQKKKITIQAN